MDNINFTGSFLVKHNSFSHWQQIYNSIAPKSRYLKHNILGEKNVFLACNDKYDKSISDYLFRNNVIFSYYPNINLKSRVHNMDKETLEAFVNSEKAMTNELEIKSFVSKRAKTFIPKDYIWRKNDHIPQSLNALRTIDYLNVDSLTYSTKKHITTFYDKDNRLVAKASPNSSRGENVIFVYPRYKEEPFIMIKADYTQNVRAKTDDIGKLTDYKKNFMIALNEDLARY